MSSNVVKVAIGAALALVLAIVVLRSGQDAAPSGPKPANVDVNAADAVRQRLDQLRASRQQGGAVEEAAGNIKVDSKVAGAPAPSLPGRPAAPAAPAPEAEMKRAPGQVPPAPQGGNVAGAPSVRDSAEDIPALKNMAINDKNVDRRLEAVTLLGATEEPDVVPVLGQALSDEDPEVRLAAIQALADFTDDGVLDLLGKAATNDPDADNRYEALDALSDLEDDRAAVYAKHALQDPDEEVRDLAQSMLGNDGGGAAPAAPAARRR